MIITLSGASGTGKTTIEKMFLEREANVRPLVSITTRAPRPNDLPGDFEYISPETYDAWDAAGAFLWKARVGETRHGTRTSDLRNAFASPRTTWIMILVPECVPNLHAFAHAEKQIEQVRSFYILNPPDDVLRRRMAERGDAPEKIEERMRACAEYQERARNSGIPYIYIEDTDDVDEKYRKVIDCCR